MTIMGSHNATPNIHEMNGVARPLSCSCMTKQPIAI
jgi:hypothetical protein